MEGLDIYRIIEPVGTSWEDVEWVTAEVLVGTYGDAYDAQRAGGYHHYSEIEFYDGETSTWKEP
jgi:hypothetical protein